MAQPFAGAAQSGGHGPHRDAEDVGGLGIAELVDVDEQQDGGELRVQRGDGAVQIVVEGSVGGRLLRAGNLSGAECWGVPLQTVVVVEQVGSLPPVRVDGRVAQDRQQPRSWVAPSKESRPR